MPAPSNRTSAPSTWTPRAVVATVVVAVVAAWTVVSVVPLIRGFLFLLLLAWLLAVGIEPAVEWLGHRGITRRGAAAGLVLLVLVVAGLALVVLLGQLVATQAGQLVGRLPETIASVTRWLNDHLGTHLDPADLRVTEIDTDRLGDLAARYGSGLLGVFGSVVGLLFDALTILVFAYYLSAGSPALLQWVGSWLPPRQQRVVVTVWTVAVDKTGGYVASKVVLAAVSAIAHAAFFWVVGVPSWLALGLLAGVVGQLVPTVGTYIGIVVPALFTIGVRPWSALWIVVFAAFYQQVENYVLTPRVSRRTMDLQPAIALGAVFVGVALFGWVGALIGIPLAAAVTSLIETFRERHALLPELKELDETPHEAPHEA